MSGGTVTARVLAGTIPRGADADEDTALSVELAKSDKNVEEHAFAIESVLEALRPYTATLEASETPSRLRLPNLWHLATDVTGTLSNGASALNLVHALHPTAAVGGTPRDVAMRIIREVEPFDRGRYAGPVGWIDGDEETASGRSLCGARSSVVPASTTSTGDDEGDDPAAADWSPGANATRRVTAHAGGGIVSGSVPESGARRDPRQVPPHRRRTGVAAAPGAAARNTTDCTSPHTPRRNACWVVRIVLPNARRPASTRGSGHMARGQDTSARAASVSQRAGSAMAASDEPARSVRLTAPANATCAASSAMRPATRATGTPASRADAATCEGTLPAADCRRRTPRL